MNNEQAVKQRHGGAMLKSLLAGVGQFVVLVAVAIGLLLPAPFVANQLPGGSVGSDLMISSWPTALLIQHTFAQMHRLPLWNPYYGGGQPLAGDPLAALFYPPTFLVPFVALRDYYLWLFLGHFVFAGLGMLLLASRVLKLQKLPALVAAVSFIATPGLVSHLGAGHVTFFQTVTWYPWLALACWATVRDPRRWGVWLGICIALTLLAGHPQMAYYGLLMTTALAVWHLACCWRQQGRRALIKPLVGLAGAAITGVLLASIHLLPLFEFTSLSTRQLSVSSSDSFPLLDFLRALIDQRLVGSIPWEGMLSPGLAVVALALFAIVTRWRRVWPLVLGIVLVAALAMGNASWFYLVVAHILPDLDLFRAPARIWFIALVPIALLAGIGTEGLLTSVQRLASRWRTSRFSRPISVVVGMLMVLLVGLTLVVSNSGYARVYDVRIATTPSLLARSAAQLAGSGKIYGVQENIPQISAVQLGVRFADGWDPLLIESYVSYMQRAGNYHIRGYQTHIPYDSPTVQPHASLLGLMNVSVVVSRRPLTDPRLIQVGDVDGTLIYMNEADAGAGYLVNPGPGGRPPLINQLYRLDNAVHIDILSPEQQKFTFTSSIAAYFVIATPSFPGWTAQLDGHDVPVQQIAGVFPAIKIGPGMHTIIYTYAPSSVVHGMLLSAFGLLIALAWLIVGYFYTKRRKVGTD